MTSMKFRPPAVAGLFYPGDAEQLKSLVSGMLNDVTSTDCKRIPKALVVPHAGLIYSGPVAACGYKVLAECAVKAGWKHLLLFGPNHRMPLSGMAISEEAFWQTPLGTVPVNEQIADQLTERFNIERRSDVHQLEHCLEVQLPFLQEVLPDIDLVPILVGHTPVEDVAAVIRYIWRQPDTLVLISSDLSHYHSWHEANRLDAITDQMIVGLEAVIRPEQACGAYALNGLLLAAREEGLRLVPLSHANSGDTAGDKERVVGYGSYICY